MKTCLVSFFDSANLGDLLIARALLDFASEFGPVERLSYSGDPFRFPDPNELPLGDAGPSGPTSLKARLVSTRAGYAAWRIRESHSLRHLRIRQTLIRSELLLLGGGNMVFDLDAWTRSSDRFGYFADTARRSGIRTFGISLGIGPFSSTKQHRDACRVLDGCGWLTFRDQNSLDLYLEHGRRPAEIGVDPVLLMEQVLERPVASSGRVAWNIVEPRLTGGVSNRERDMLLHKHATAIGSLISDGLFVELFSTDRADEASLEELETLVGSPACRVRPIAGLTALLEFYLEVDVVVASRMHALIVAFTQGVPVLGLSWQQKVRAFFDLIGRPDQCLSFLDLDLESAGGLIDRARADPERFVVHESDRAHIQCLNAANRRVMAEINEEKA